MTKQRIHIITAVLLFLPFVPYLLLGDQAYIRIHDTLEGELNWFRLLLISDTGRDLSPGAVVPQVMNGLPRSALHSPLQATYWFMDLFGICHGYWMNKFLLTFMAFGGMYLLLRDRLKVSDPMLLSGSALAYAFVPFYSVFGASFAGLPWVFRAFGDLLDGRRTWFSVAVLVLFPFWSSIVWAAPAVLLALGCWWLSGVGEAKRKLLPVTVLGLMVVAYLTANFPMLRSYFLPDSAWVSHREAYDFKAFKPFSWGGSLASTAYSIFLGHYHVGTFFTGLIWATYLGARIRGAASRFLNRLALLILAISLFAGFYNGIIYLFSDSIRLVETFRFDRIQILLPMLTLILFAGSLHQLVRTDPAWKRTAGWLIMAQVVITLSINDEFIHNLRELTGTGIKPNYSEYYAEDLMDDVADHIGLPESEYRVLSVGMSPAVAQHSGFYTLDGLHAMYPLAYKQAFRRIIAGELERDASLKRYFDLWGNRCYAFSAELGKEDHAFLIQADSGRRIDELRYDTGAILDLGGWYVFAALPVGNAEALGWTLDGIFSSPQSWWKVYLYRVGL